MSIFDSASNSKKKFFQKIHYDNDPVFKEKILFETKILYQMKHSIIREYSIRITPYNLLLFKGKNNMKLMNFNDMYKVKSYLSDPQRVHPDLIYYVAFQKDDKLWLFYLETENQLVDLIKILKKTCVFNHFYDDYKTLNLLGKGHFAKVFSVKNIKTNEIFAAKIFNKNSEVFLKNKDYVLREIKIMRNLPENPYILPLFEIYEEKNELILVLQYMEGENLFNYVKNKQKLSENQIYLIFEQILKGLLFLQCYGVIHRDLKPENILFSDKNEKSALKIADFGLSTFIGKKEKLKEQCGTPGFMAPEIFTPEGYDENVDVFSLGIILYTLFAHRPAFKGNSVKAILEKNQKGRVAFHSSQWDCYSKEAKILVKKMLEKKPENRIKLFDICHEKWVRQQRKILKEKVSLDHEFSSTNLRMEESSHECFNESLHYNNTLHKNLISKKNSNEVFLLKSESPNNARKEHMDCLSMKNKSNISYEVPSYFQNYSVDSFMMYSKSDFKSNTTQKSSNFSLDIPMVASPLKKSMISFDNFDNSLEILIKDHQIKRAKTFIHERKEEQGNSCETRFKSDLNLEFIVPNLVTLPFKSKKF